MGAWSHKPFDNDDANDWAYGLEGVKDFSYIEETLDNVLEADGYLEAPSASEAVAAVEVLARLLGKGIQSGSYPVEVDRWIETVSVTPNPALLQKASQALERILGEDSELRELWEDGDFTGWQNSITALQRALGK